MPFLVNILMGKMNSCYWHSPSFLFTCLSESLDWKSSYTLEYNIKKLWKTESVLITLALSDKDVLCEQYEICKHDTHGKQFQCHFATLTLFLREQEITPKIENIKFTH